MSRGPRSVFRANPATRRTRWAMAQLVYDPPRSIHGTTDPTSIGKPVSHGSIRVTNEVALQLAREVMEAGGAGKDDAWYAAATKNRTEKQIIDLPIQSRSASSDIAFPACRPPWHPLPR